MGKRLEITIIGTMYVAGALHLDKGLLQAGIKTYGADKWEQTIYDIALGKISGKPVAEIAHTLGYPIKRACGASGIAFQDNYFGLEVFYNGLHQLIHAVDNKRHDFLPAVCMADFEKTDLLGVFWAKRDGALTFRWDDIDDFHQDEITLVSRDLATFLSTSEPLELVENVLFRGDVGKKRDVAKNDAFHSPGKVFHGLKKGQGAHG